jgi:hypothetical protein
MLYRKVIAMHGSVSADRYLKEPNQKLSSIRTHGHNHQTRRQQLGRKGLLDPDPNGRQTRRKGHLHEKPVSQLKLKNKSIKK